MSKKQNISNVDDLEVFFNQSQVFDIYNLDRIGVFGSFARGEDQFNDIDLLVNSTDLKRMADFRMFLNNNTSFKFDVVTEEFCNPIVLHRAKKDIKYVQKR